MAYIYSDSEKFRAQLFLLLGTVLLTPFCIFILSSLQEDHSYSTAKWTLVSFTQYLD